jgi:hypothetical protein
MNPSNSAKFGVAFAAGLVVALAGVTIYVKTSGLHVQEAVETAPVVQQNKQPETLNPPKIEDPATVQTPPAAVTPAPQAVAPPPVQEPAKTQQPTVPPRVGYKPVTRSHYHNAPLPESQSTIRVEVSQMKTPTEPIGAPTQSPVPVPAQSGQPIRTVNEDQVVPAPAPISPPAPQPHTVTLQAGTNLVVRLGETLSTDHNYSGDTFRATLDKPIILDGFVIADKGSKVLGKITGIDKAGKFEGTSNLQLALTEINTTDGQRVRIQTGFFNKKGAANNGGEVAKVGGGAVLGAVIGAIAGGGKGAAIGAGAGGAIGAGTVMAGKGRPAVINTETQLTFQLSSPTTITEHLNE